MFTRKVLPIVAIAAMTASAANAGFSLRIGGVIGSEGSRGGIWIGAGTSRPTPVHVVTAPAPCHDRVVAVPGHGRGIGHARGHYNNGKAVVVTHGHGHVVTRHRSSICTVIAPPRPIVTCRPPVVVHRPPVVVHHEVLVAPQPRVVVTEPVVHVEPADVTVWVVNSNHSKTPVVLTRNGPGYVGPRGEYYPEMPNNEQLRMVYGF